MFEKCDLMLLRAKMRVDAYMDRFLNEEKGASDIVAILVVIVILIAVAGLFKTQLMGIVNAVFTKVTTFINQD